MKRFGTWILDQLIAVGGIAEVWEARAGLADTDDRDGTDAPGSNVPIALKRMHTHLVHNDEACALFASEQALTTSLPRHPHVVHGIAAGSIDNLPFIALSRAPGHDLRRYLAPPIIKGAPPPSSVTLPRAQAIAIVATACEAAHHLHAHGWIHGDINPGNLVVDLDTQVTAHDPPVTLIDLGVCRKIGEGGTVRGTHAYMAPEQVKGGAWSPATDVFALGVVLWELVAGARLFHRGPPWLSMSAVVEHTPAKLADASLDDIARAALAKDPADRIASAADLGAQLRSLNAN